MRPDLTLNTGLRRAYANVSREITMGNMDPGAEFSPNSRSASEPAARPRVIVRSLPILA
jgi:hypothetical protein